jgi:hypothetical protein
MIRRGVSNEISRVRIDRQGIRTTVDGVARQRWSPDFTTLNLARRSVSPTVKFTVRNMSYYELLLALILRASEEHWSLKSLLALRFSC